MKKRIALLLVLVMLLSLAACGEEKKSGQKESEQTSNEPQPTQTEPTQPSEPAGTVYDTGEFRVFVPAGWNVIPCTDIWAEDPNTLDPSAVNLCKGGTTDFDLFSKPYIRIDHYGEDTTMGKPDKEWYDDGVDLAPFSTGKHHWTGFSAVTLGYPITVLWTEEGVHKYQITIYTDQEGGKISAEDADVQEILSSITANEP